MTTDIFIRSYRKDFPWLKYCLRSIRKYAPNFRQTVIVIPKDDWKVLRDAHIIEDEAVFLCQDEGDGYLAQQVTKMQADKYSNADYFCFIDSDCVFTRPTEPSDFFEERKPVLLITPYSVLPKEVPWQPITEKALGFPCPFETMRRHPMVAPASLLRETRDHITRTHDRPWSAYILTQPFRSFSEFNAIGAYALEKRPELFRFLDTTKEPLPPEYVKQMWSWGGITPEVKKVWESLDLL